MSQPHSTTATTAISHPAWLLDMALECQAVDCDEDLDRLCQRVSDISPCQAALYEYTPERPLRARARAEWPGAESLPSKIDPAHPWYAEVYSKRANPALPIADQTQPRPQHIWAIPLFHRRQRAGLLVVLWYRAADPSCQRALKHFGEYLLDASLRISRYRKKKEKCRTLQHIISKTEEIFCSWTKQRGWEFHNRHQAYRIGYSIDQLPLENIFGHYSIVHPEDVSALRKALSACMKQGQTQTCHYRIFDPKGELHFFTSNLHPLQKAEDGSAIHIAGVSVEETKTKTLQQETTQHIDLNKWLLDQTNRLYTECQKSSVEAVLEESTKRFKLNRCYVRLYQGGVVQLYAEQHTPGLQPVSELLPNFEFSGEVPNAVTLVHNDTEDEKELMVLKNNCRRIHVRAQIWTPLLQHGQLIGSLCWQNSEPRVWSSMEVRAAQVLAEAMSVVVENETILQQLNHSREQFQLAMDAASYGLWEMNLVTQMIYVNPTYYRMLGYDTRRFSSDKLESFQPFSVDHIHIDDKDIISQAIADLTSGTINAFSHEARHVMLNGKIMWILMVGRIVKRAEDQTPLVAMGTVTDISAIKKSQTDLQIAYQEAESEHTAKSEFLARMSHEIRTPMNAIIGMTYLISESALSDQQQRYIHDIDQAAKSLLTIIDDILDYSKLEADKLHIDNHSFNLHRQLERLADHYSRPADDVVQLIFQLSQNVPIFIHGDSTRLRQVLSHLLDNAFKFTAAGQVCLRVYMEADEIGAELLHFYISDTGIGMQASQLATLFDPFTQADGSSSRKYGGTGLGLTIAQRLVGLMGGEIVVQSTPGEGSHFHFKLPVTAATADQTAHHLEEHQQQDKLQNKKILLVEDNKVNQQVAAGILRKLGVEVSIANNGTEAVFAIKNHPPKQFAAVLMDIEMPFMDGFEATTEIRAIDNLQELPIVAMTAHMDTDKQRYLAAGMNDVITKPISPSRLYALLANIIEAPRAGASD